MQNIFICFHHLKFWLFFKVKIRANVFRYFCSSEETPRYTKLEILLLDDNKLEDVSVFAALAGLPRFVL